MTRVFAISLQIDFVQTYLIFMENTVIVRKTNECVKIICIRSQD